MQLKKLAAAILAIVLCILILAFVWLAMSPPIANAQENNAAIAAPAGYVAFYSQGTVGFDIQGTFSAGALTPQVSIDGKHWYTWSVYPITSGAPGSAVVTITSTGQFVASTAGYPNFRLLANGSFGGSLTIFYGTSTSSMAALAGSVSVTASTNANVQGAQAAGASPTENPVMTGGYDQTSAIIRNDMSTDVLGDGISLDGQNGAAWKNVASALLVQVGDGLNLVRSIGTIKSASVAAIGSAATIWAPASGKKFRLMKYCLVGSAAGNITLTDGTSTPPTIIVIPTAAGGACMPADLGNGYLSTTANNVMQATGSVSMNLSGWVAGDEE